MIDKKLSKSIMDRYNSGEIGKEPKAQLNSIPEIDNKTIIDFTKNIQLEVTNKEIESLFIKYDLPESLKRECLEKSNIFDASFLTKVGIHLYPYFSYGVLNGGSATSYVDFTKNRQFDDQLFTDLEMTINELTPKYKGKAKGITPAFINPNKSPGPSFMELKMRSLLLEAKKYKILTGKKTDKLFPIFQMTSTTNTADILDFYKKSVNSTYLKDLTQLTLNNITEVKTAIQPLISAFTHSNKGDEKSIFLDSDGNQLALPGGHGQCFKVLKDIFIELYNEGIRFISIGNVDNIGYTLDPKALAILAITGKQATFDFSFKTEFDVKGGILINDQFNRLSCADLGVAVSKEDVQKAEQDGIPILFNCATGLFNLELLIEKIDFISKNLPTRFTDQNKDIGLYSQAEQVTWEVISILDEFIILAVDKYERFLASKLLIENLVTSGLATNIKNIELEKCAQALYDGLSNQLVNTFKLKLTNGEWLNND